MWFKLITNALEIAGSIILLIVTILFFSLLWASQTGDSYKTSLFIMGGYFVILGLGSGVYHLFKKDDKQ